MKKYLLRLGVMGSLALLGWVAVATAQSNESGNPLRATGASPQPFPPTVQEPASRRPSADPFGLHAPTTGSAPAAPALDSPSSGALPAASAPTATPSSGPALISGDMQEPAPFRADPFAKKTGPGFASPSDRDAFRSARLSRDGGRFSDAAGEAEGTGQPGGPHLEGVQTPQLTIEKTAPKEIQVGKPAIFRVTVRNVGRTPAGEVEIRDQIPKGTRLAGTTPQAERGPRGDLVWKLGTLRPGEEAAVEMQLIPTAEGEIGSVATVHFGADATARSIATRPQLVIETSAPPQVLIGEQVTLGITISNPGTGMATGVVLIEKIPPGLQHPAGAELEYEVGALKPGESRKLDLPLAAYQPGPTTNLLIARAEGDLQVENRRDIEVIAPLLDVAVEGPKKRYLDRQATYLVSVSNPGTATAKHVELTASLPPGMKFIRANNAGYYEESTRTVRWRLEELPANETGTVELVALPTEPGQHALKLRGTSQKGLNVEKEQPVIVEGIAAILFQVADTVDPVEIGGETGFEVQVVNQGSKAASNVRLAIDLPPEVKFLAAEGPTRYEVAGHRVLFDGLSRLPPKSDTQFRIRVQAVRPGDLRTRFQLLTDDMQSPVTKEESTRVYADE